MTVKKLTDADRKEILDLYRHTGETTSTLADRYGVSNSTISRFLKVTLPEEEYETLIAAKRAARTSSAEGTSTPQQYQLELEVALSEPVEEEPVSNPIPVTPTPTIKRRRVSATQPKTEIPQAEIPQTEIPQAQTLQIASPEVDLTNTAVTADTSNLNPSLASLEARSPVYEDVNAKANAIAEIFGEELLEESEEDDDDDDDDDIYDEDDDDEDEEQPILRRRLPLETLVQVLPLTEAILPRTCYLVIDRSAELITRPLREFGDLGQIPSQEFGQRTLPVFDNHRVARRFSSKRDRVIKVPDSRMLQKTRSHLQAKGITRLLFDGRVYSLSSS
jgi:transposase-like protein